MEDTFSPEVRLGTHDLTALAGFVVHPGFKVFQKIAKSRIDQFTLAMINADPAVPETVLARHKQCKAAAQFYEGLIQTISNATTTFHSLERTTDQPVDVTSGVLDIGEYADVDDLMEESD